MALPIPKIEEKKNTIVNYFHEVCQGLTIVMFYAMIWTLLGAVVYRIIMWAF